MHWYDWFLQKAIELKITPIFYVPGLEFKDDEFARRLIYSRKLLTKKLVYKLSRAESQKLIMGALYERARKKYGPQVFWIDFKEFLCTESECSYEINGYPLLFDKSHITLEAGKILERKYREKYPNIFLASLKNL